MTPELLALLTPEQREAWERCQKATPGPWRPEQTVINGESYGITGVETEHPDGVEVARGSYSQTVVQNVHGFRTFGKQVCDNARFIAHARQDLPAVLLELAQAEQALAELRAAVADAPHDMWCAVTFPAAPAELMSCNCWKSETK